MIQTMGKNNSKVLDAVHETASDLHKLGFIDKQAMANYNALCIPPVSDYTSDKLNLSANATTLAGRTGKRSECQFVNNPKMGNR